MSKPPTEREFQMLVLSREVEQRIYIGDTVVVTVVSVEGKRICIGIEAPAEIPILREEVRNRGNTGPGFDRAATDDLLRADGQIPPVGVHESGEPERQYKSSVYLFDFMTFAGMDTSCNFPKGRPQPQAGIPHIVAENQKHDEDIRRRCEDCNKNTNVRPAASTHPELKGK